MRAMEAAGQTLWVDLGTEDYLAVFHLQHELSELRRAGRISDVVLAVEHPPCLTVGRGGREEHILAGEEALATAGIRVHYTDRGGDVTYHGPGQLVCYPIVDLRKYGKDVHAHVRRLEEVMIRTIAALDVPAYRDPAYPGAWTARGKIGAVGIGVRRWVTMHGASLNVCPRMEHYELLVPCGLRHRPVTSLEQDLGRSVGMEAVRRHLRRAFAEVFPVALRDVERGEFEAALGGRERDRLRPAAERGALEPVLCAS